MNPYSFLALLKWPVTLGVLGGLLWLAYLIHHRAQATETAEQAVRAADKEQDGALKFSKQLKDAFGVEWEPAEKVAWQEEATVHGRVVPNPRAAVEVRAPFSGTLRADPNYPWPALGTHVDLEEGKPVRLGWVDIRVGPQDRLDLLAKVQGAERRLEGAEKVYTLRKAQFDRLDMAYKGRSGAVTLQEVENAQATLHEAQTQRDIAADEVKLWQDGLAALDRRGAQPSVTWSRPLLAPLAGEVTAVSGPPGTTVETGEVVFRVVDATKVLVRLDLPLRLLTEGPPGAVQLAAYQPVATGLRGATNQTAAPDAPQTVTAKLVGSVPQVDTASQYAGYWYEVTDATPAPRFWRPGLFVRAAVKVASAPVEEAVTVPVGAVLYHQGRTLVWVRLKSADKADRFEHFVRREVRVLGRQGERYILAKRDRTQDLAKVGVEPGEDVVTENPQVLLSEEFRSDVDTD